jgi:predicted ATP-grasp superfamily ATP-dependent carboligase
VERLCLYEWAAAGGLDGPDGACVTNDPVLAEAVRGEGVAMLATLTRLSTSLRGVAPQVLVGHGVRYEPPAGVEVVRVPRGGEAEALAAAAALADWLVVVAPETAGILERRLRIAHQSTGRVVGPSVAFASLAADKHATILALAAAGVPVPAGRLLRTGEIPPKEFYLPMVRKQRGSVGCDGLHVIHEWRQGCDAAETDERLEAFAPGMPVGVSLLCGPAGVFPLPGTRQRFGGGSSPQYMGGQLPVAAHVAVRAEHLARRAMHALSHRLPAVPGEPPAVAGWVGVDMIIGDREDGRDDRVLEVNPRVTTSLVGLAAFSRQNLMEAMLTVAAGGRPDLTFDLPSVETPHDFVATLPC